MRPLLWKRFGVLDWNFIVASATLTYSDVVVVAVGWRLARVSVLKRKGFGTVGPSAITKRNG